MMFDRLLSTLSPVHKAMLYAVIGYTGFSFSDTAIKALGQSYSIYQILSINLLLASVLLVATVPLWENNKQSIPQRFKSAVFKLHVLRGFLNFVLALLFISALMALTMATVYTLIFTTPFYAVIITALLYKEKMRGYRWLSILLGFIGILVVVRPTAEGINPIMLAPLCASVLAALLFVVSKSMTKETNFTMGFYPSFIAGVLCLPLAYHHGFIMLEMGDLIYCIISAIGINIGVIFVSKAYAIAPSAAVAPFHYSQILWGLIFGFFIFSEVPDRLTLLGAAIVIGSGLFLVFMEKRELENSSSTL